MGLILAPPQACAQLSKEPGLCTSAARKGSEPAESWLCRAESRVPAVHRAQSAPSNFVPFWVDSFWVAMRWALTFRATFSRASLEAPYGPVMGKGSMLNSEGVLLCFRVSVLHRASVLLRVLLAGLKALWGGLVLSQSLLSQRCPATCP